MALIAYGLARLGRDAEVRYLTDGTAVCNLSLAFVCGRKGSDGKRPTQWVEGSLWGKQAEALAPYLLTGGKVSVSIEDLHIEAFKKADGTAMTKLTGRVLSIEFAGDPTKREETPPAASRSQPPARTAAPASAPRAAPSYSLMEMDDDIPF